MGFKTFIQPSPEAIRRHYEALRDIIDRNRNTPQAQLIAQLNPVIRGWANYYSAGVSKRTFTKLDNRLYFKLRQWAYRRHPRHSHGWIVRKYWRLESGRWTFGTPDGEKILFTHAHVPIQRHIKVRGTKSPYDGDWVYWATRLGRQPDLRPRQAKLLKRQRGRCAWCHLFFKAGDRMELDHIIPKSLGGQEGYANWQLLHGHCHDQKTAGDQLRASACDKGHPIEEPDEAKTSCPVLKTSRKGDQPA